jgi:hypothetical protein
MATHEDTDIHQTLPTEPDESGSRSGDEVEPVPSTSSSGLLQRVAHPVLNNASQSRNTEPTTLYLVSEPSSREPSSEREQQSAVQEKRGVKRNITSNQELNYLRNKGDKHGISTELNYFCNMEVKIPTKYK